jgi:predicted ATPase/class 3 adenylate cyclase
MSLTCQQCGFLNPPGMRFCGNCGTHLPESQPPQPPTDLIEPSTVPERLGAMVGANLLERFRRAGLDAAGQRRNVTVLFADLSGYTELSTRIDGEDLYELIQKFIHVLANDVYKYEGMVDKFTGDGLMALFGAPIAHENNAELAIRAALDMLEDVAELSKDMRERLAVTELSVHIGLHAGMVIVGSIGSDMLMNYTAIGDIVNLAQRLDASANPGTILVSEAIYRQTKALFNFSHPSTFQLKGISDPVKGYQVLGPKVIAGSVRGIEGLRASMIGRDSELGILMQIIGVLTAYYQGRFAMVVGEAGLGKSRLISEVIALSRKLRVTFLQGQSLTYRRSVSYWIFLDLLRQYLNVTADTPTTQIAESLCTKATEILGPRARELIPYLERLLSLPPSDLAAANRIEYLDAGQLRQQIHMAVRDLLVAESRRQPLVLVLEDIHWADEASLDLLNFLLESIQHAPLLIIGISRPDQESKLSKIIEKAEQSLANNFSIIHLQSLSPQQSKQLLYQLLSTPNFPETLWEQIVQRAAGIPFYLEEILRMLIDTGYVRRENNRWNITEGKDIRSLGVPDTLQGLILARFDHLNPAHRQVLQVASVIGRRFGFPLLCAVLSPIPEQDIQGILTFLTDREFLIPQQDALVTEHEFRHVLVSDTIYGTLLKRDRADLHGKVGDAIEVIYANRLDEQVDLLARHYAWSPKTGKALQYLILAAQKASRSYVNDQARHHFEDALALLSQVNHTSNQAYQVHKGFGDILVLVGEYQTAREHYQISLDVLARENPNLSIGERSDLQRRIGTTYEHQGDYDQALLCLETARQILNESPQGRPIETARILNDIGWIHSRRGNIEEAEKYLLEALSFAKDTSNYDVTASIYNRLGGVYYQKNQLEQASDYVQKSLGLREEIGDIVAVARSYNNLGLLNWKVGKWEKALDNFTHSFELHANLGDVEGMLDLQSNLGLLQLDRGNMEKAREHLDNALATAQKIGHPFIIGVVYLYYSRLYVSFEEWQSALDYSNRCLGIFKEIGDQEHLIEAYINLGQTWLGLGDIALAQQWSEEALRLLETIGSGKTPMQAEDRGRVLLLMGEIARLQQNHPQASKFVREAAEIFSILGIRLEQGRSTVSLALLAASQGTQTRARVLFNKARLIFRQLGANQDLSKLENISLKASSNKKRRSVS